MDDDSRQQMLRRWKKAVRRSFDWMEDGEERTVISLGEFIGTIVLILLGNGVVAGVLLKKSKGENAGWIAITAGWAFAVFAASSPRSHAAAADAHLNPAVTIGAAVNTGDCSKVLPYALAQIAGAMLGAVLVWLHYLPHWGETADQELKLGASPPAPRSDIPAQSDQRDHRDIRARAGRDSDLSARVSRRGLPPASDRTWSAASCGASDCASAARRGMRSTRPATSGRASCTPFCQFRTRAIPIGVRGRCRSSVR